MSVLEYGVWLPLQMQHVRRARLDGRTTDLVSNEKGRKYIQQRSLTFSEQRQPGYIITERDKQKTVARAICVLAGAV